MPSVLLRFTVIKARASEILGIPADDVSDQHLGEMFGLARETVWRLRTGRAKPNLDTALDMARVLRMPVEDFATRVMAGE